MGEGGPVFQMGGGFIFKWGVCLMGGITFDGGGRFEKNSRVGGHPLRPTPLWETLYMENFKQIMDDSKQ